MDISDRPRGAGKSSFSLIDADRLFAELPLGTGHVFLDLACGSGAYSLEAARRFGAGLRIHALDLAPDLIAGLRARLAEESIPNITAAVADIGRCIPLADDSVDACLTAMILHDLVADKTEASALGEVRRVLKPGGLLAAVEFKKVPPPPGPPLQVRLAEAELETLLGRYGFSKVKTAEISDCAYLSIFRAPGS